MTEFEEGSNMTTQQFSSRAARLGFSTFVPVSASRDDYYQANDIRNVVLMSPEGAVGSAQSEAFEAGAKGIPAQGEAGPVNNHVCGVVHKKESQATFPSGVE